MFLENIQGSRLAGTNMCLWCVCVIVSGSVCMVGAGGVFAELCADDVLVYVQVLCLEDCARVVGVCVCLCVCARVCMRAGGGPVY